MTKRTVLFAGVGFFAVAAMVAANGALWKPVTPVADAAAVDYFLKIDGIDGESRDEKHKNEIEIMSWSWGMSNAGAHGTGGGGGAGKVVQDDLAITKLVDKASPQFLLACANGKHFPKAVLTVRKSGGDQEDYLRYSFFDVFCEVYQDHGEGGNFPMENVSLNYAKVQIDYTQQKPDGKPGDTFTSSWDFKKNTGSSSGGTPTPTPTATPTPTPTSTVIPTTDQVQ